VLVTNGDVDHVTGLLGLRERQPLIMLATQNTLDRLGENRIFGVLADDMVRRVSVTLGERVEALPGLHVEIFAVPGKVPLWLETGSVEIGVEDGSTIGVTVSVGGTRAVYIPGCAAVSESVRAQIDGADALLFDGTLFTDEEMIAAGVGTKTGRRMGHMPISGAGSSIDALADIATGRRIFIHLNNTNPVLIEGSAERRATEARGWEIAFDGMELLL
jgi:pyrroloquinoline quinone biosynthesis protein B